MGCSQEHSGGRGVSLPCSLGAVGQEVMLPGGEGNSSIRSRVIRIR